ncbi:cell division protein ZapA [Aureibacillus halotolerans]|uniref:Cell division protein ZapA n=1 Tax=Aureibacillus halotolerans TaxID=1508390 RepID=A0A4R6U1K2_9BACI|nr:cell division protein ZapA [Aureibacillus halotolerans]TDQ39172.1 cell division protein ZapA [Aureibacillus halotolerans]
MSGKQKNKTTITIYGQPFTIVGSENTSHIRDVAESVDDTMRDLDLKHPYLGMNRLAILAAVNVTNDYAKLQKAYEQLKQDYDLLQTYIRKEEKLKDA